VLCSAGLNLSFNAIDNTGLCVSVIYSSNLTKLITVICQLQLLHRNIFHYSRLSSPPRVNIGLNSRHNITGLILSLYLHLTGTVLLQSKEGVR